MGEKIKDLKEITIGNVKLMIELNHGYTKKQGNVIHIQNKHFRYLLNLNDFLRTAAAILRSKKELDYIKTHPNIETRDLSLNTELVLDRSINADSFLDFLDKEKINYKYIEECPRLKTIIINPSDWKKAHNLFISGKSFTVLKHPYSSFFGYAFLYQMKEFDLIKYDNKYYEIFYQLPCHSLTPKTWIPLDNLIQRAAWENDEKILDDKIYYVYRLCWAIFKDQAFSLNTINTLIYNKHVLKDKDFIEYLKPVFFNFSDKLLDLLKSEKFDEIVIDYRTYNNY